MIKKTQEKFIHPELYDALCAIKRGAERAHEAFTRALFNAFEEDVVHALERQKRDLRKAGVFADEELVFDIFAGFEQLLLFTAASAHAVGENAPTKDEHAQAMLIISTRTIQLTHRLADILAFESEEPATTQAMLAIEDAPRRLSNDSSASGDTGLDSGVASLTNSPKSSTSMSSMEEYPQPPLKLPYVPKKSCLRSKSSKSRRKNNVAWLDLYKAPQHWTEDFSDAFEFDMPEFNIDVWGLVKCIPGVRTTCKVARAIRNIPTTVEDALCAALEELRVTNEILSGSGLFSPRPDGGCPCCSLDWQDAFEDDKSRQTQRD